MSRLYNKYNKKIIIILITLFIIFLFYKFKDKVFEVLMSFASYLEIISAAELL